MELRKPVALDVKLGYTVGKQTEEYAGLRQDLDVFIMQKILVWYRNRAYYQTPVIVNEGKLGKEVDKYAQQLRNLSNLKLNHVRETYKECIERVIMKDDVNLCWV